MNIILIVFLDKNDYSYNELVYFYCDGDYILYGLFFVRCIENGWKYDGLFLFVCRCKWVYMYFIIILVIKVIYCDLCLFICVCLFFVKMVE